MMADAAQTERLRYQSGRLLDSRVLAARQAYHLEARRRHNLMQHGCGVVSGLEVVLDAGGKPVLRAGLAIDGYGREIVVPADRRLDAPATAESAAGRYNLVLEYRLEQGEDPRDRWRESHAAYMQPAGDGPAGLESEASQEGAAATDPLQRVLPADPADEAAIAPWPVCLGQAVLDGEGVWTIDTTGRRSAALSAALLKHPQDGTTLALGGCDARRPAGLEVTGAGASARALRLEASGLALAGPLAISAGAALTIDGGALVLRLAPAPAPADEKTLTKPLPWRLGLDPDPAQDTATAAVGAQRLRVTLGPVHEGTSRAASRFTVGVRTAQGEFRPVLTVSAEGRITVHGDLVVRGAVTEPPIDADPSDPRFTAALAAIWQAGDRPGAADGPPAGHSGDRR